MRCFGEAKETCRLGKWLGPLSTLKHPAQTKTTERMRQWLPLTLRLKTNKLSEILTPIPQKRFDQGWIVQLWKVCMGGWRGGVECKCRTGPRRVLKKKAPLLDWRHECTRTAFFF